MNNTNAIALIKTGELSTGKMLELCEKATDDYNDDPRHLDVVRAFVRNWKSANPLASNQNLIDVVASSSTSVQANTVYTIASEMSQEDFEYGFQKLLCEEDLIFAAGASGKYNQEKIFSISQRLDYNSRPPFWEGVVKGDFLDSEGLYAVAMLGHQNRVGMQKLCLLVIHKKVLNAEQLMNVCEKYSSRNEEALAAISTGLLSDDQIVSLFSMEMRRDLEWDEVAEYLDLEERTVEDLLTLGEKANSDKLWPSITAAINSKKAVRA